MTSYKVIDLDDMMNNSSNNITEYNNDSEHYSSTESIPEKKTRFDLNKNKYKNISKSSIKSSEQSEKSTSSGSMIKRVVNRFKSNSKINRINSNGIHSETRSTFIINDELNIDMLDNNAILNKITDILNKITNSENINNKDFIKDIFEMFKDKHYIMFVKKKKLNYYDINCFSGAFMKKRSCSKIDPDNFRGCLFLPIEEIEKILMIVDTYNRILSSNHINNKILNYSNDNKYLFIHFDENSIKKNHLYKRLDILNKINFISLKEYQTKITEYKIRGLCQIAEELGAKEIDIHFEKNLKNTIMKETKVNMEINSIAGNLGLKKSSSDSKNEDYSYTLNYEQINNIELNDYKIINKIKNHKLFISEKMFHSNLELQYLISSRCRHFITNYNTTFNIDTETAVDKELEAKFKKNGYSVGVSGKNSKTISNHLKICTDIKFYTIDDYHNYITGYNVPFNEVGFNHLMSSLNYENEEKFNEQGIYKIINFINGYVYNVIKNNDNNKYKKISNILNLIKKRMTLNEYAECLLNYFNLNSSWTQFEYFINVLADDTKSIDDITYLIIYDKYESTKDYKNLINDIILLIQNKCKQLDIEDKFYKMLRPNSLKTRFLLIYLIVNDYKLFNTFNLFGLNNLVDNIKKYEVYTNDIQYNNIELEQENGENKTIYKYFTLNEYDIKNEKFMVNLNNMKIGFRLWEFYSNMVPFMYEIYLIIFNNMIEEKVIDIKNKVYYNDLFNSFINYNDFNVSNITSFKLLNNYINDVINIIKSGLNMKQDIINNYINNNKNSINEKVSISKDAFEMDFPNEVRTFKKPKSARFASRIEMAHGSNIKEYLINYMLCNNKFSFFTIKLNFIINNNYNNLNTYIENIYNKSIINESYLLSPSMDNIMKTQNDYGSYSQSDTINNELIMSNNDKFIYKFIKNIISYNHHNINIDSIPLNKFGYELILKNYLVGIEEIEFNKLIKPFTINLINYVNNNIITNYNYEQFKQLEKYNYSFLKYIESLDIKNIPSEIA